MTVSVWLAGSLSSPVPGLSSSIDAASERQGLQRERERGTEEAPRKGTPTTIATTFTHSFPFSPLLCLCVCVRVCVVFAHAPSFFLTSNSLLSLARRQQDPLYSNSATVPHIEHYRKQQWDNNNGALALLRHFWTIFSAEKSVRKRFSRVPLS